MSFSGENNTKPLNWYGLAKNPKANNRFEQEYCEYCLNNFKKYYQLINNVCTSCGRTPHFIKDVNQQAKVKLTAISDRLTENGTNLFKGVSMDVDYSDILNDDASRQIQNDRMIARSAGEAIRSINKTEKQQSKYYQAMASTQSPTPHVKFRVKTTIDKDFKSDNPNESEL